ADPEVARAENTALGGPDPRRVVGLALAVTQLEAFAADAQRYGVVVGDIGPEELFRPRDALDPELDAVDVLVQPAHAGIGVEPAHHVAVADDLRSDAALVDPGPGAEGVVEVSVRVD